MDVAVLVPLRLVDAVTPGKDDIGSPHQQCLVVTQFLGSETKGRQLVHAVIDHRSSFDMLRNGVHQRRVEPQNRRA